MGEENIFFWIIVSMAIAYVINRMMTRFLPNFLPRKQNGKSYREEISEILTKDEHKVKGRFD